MFDSEVLCPMDGACKLPWKDSLRPLRANVRYLIRILGKLNRYNPASILAERC